MPDLRIRNLSPDLHARLKAAAIAHRRSVTQETIATIERGLRAEGVPIPPMLPKPIQLRRPTTMEETLRLIDDGLEQRGMPDNP